MSKGTAFEIHAKEFLKSLFEELGFLVMECRLQKSGTQNGFDIRVTFLDESDNQREFYFECKDYTVDLPYSELLRKMHELHASNHKVDGFIALSPRRNVSNIGVNVNEKLGPMFRFPVRFWTPECGVKDYFSLNRDLYKILYGEEVNGVDKDLICKKLQAVINNILQEKDSYEFTNKIFIKEADRPPDEHTTLKTTLDEKLNSLFEEGDPIRIDFHKHRCDYKVFLEDLQDTNNELRQSLIRWQNDMRVKAQRLTLKFTMDPEYKPDRFFHEFFETAEKDMLRFLEEERLIGDKQKLLNGIIFELAAECPLNWNK